MFYRRRTRKAIKDFIFTNDYQLSQDIKDEYKRIKISFKEILSNIDKYNNKYNNNNSYNKDNKDNNSYNNKYNNNKDNNSYNNKDNNKYKLAYNIILSMYEFTDIANQYMTLLIDELFTHHKSLKRKKELFILLNKLFKLFYIFDVQKNRNYKILSDFSNYKNTKINIHHRDNTYIRSHEYLSSLYHKLTIFTSISMPMAHLFISYFYTDEIIIANEYKKRNKIYLSKNKEEIVYQIVNICIHYNKDKDKGSINNKDNIELKYIKLYFISLFNRFYTSDFFIENVQQMESSLINYYLGILSIK